MLRFRSSLRRKRARPSAGIGTWWLIWRMPVLLLVVMALWWFAIRPITQPDDEWVRVTTRFAICAESGQREAGCVVDGDTLVLGFGAGQRRIRLTGFDAPELDSACEAERSAALAARGRLQQWLNQGAFEWSGGREPPYDQYGRELREVRRTPSDGRSERLAETMIAEELASESGWGTFPRDWCA